MTSRHALGILLVLALCLPASPAGAEGAKRYVAVLEFENPARLKPFDLQMLSDDARAAAREVLPMSGFVVVQRESMLKMLDDSKKDLAHCSEAGCEVEFGEMIGAHYVMSGVVGLFEGMYEVRVKLFDVRTRDFLGEARSSGEKLTPMRNDLRKQVANLLASRVPGATLGSSVPPEPAPAPASAWVPAPAPVVDATGPRVKAGAVTAAVGDLTVQAKTASGSAVRLEVTDPAAQGGGGRSYMLSLACDFRPGGMAPTLDSRVRTMERLEPVNPDLSEVVRRLVEALQPDGIYLYGSRARGDASPESDYDLLVVVPTSDLPGYRRDALALKALWGLRLPVDVIVLTREEFDCRRSVVCSLPATVIREGRLLHAA